MYSYSIVPVFSSLIKYLFSKTFSAFVDNLISSYLSLKFLPQVSHHNPEFEFVHEIDVIRAFHHLIFNGESGIYNISSDDSISLKEIAEEMNSKLVSIPKLLARQIAFLSWHIIPSVVKIPPYTIDFFAHSFLTDNNFMVESYSFHKVYKKNNVIPSFELLKCHENKGFQELFMEIKNVSSGLGAEYYGSIKDV